MKYAEFSDFIRISHTPHLAWLGEGSPRAKLVRPDFTQANYTHWRKRAIEWNRIQIDSFKG